MDTDDVNNAAAKDSSTAVHACNISPCLKDVGKKLLQNSFAVIRIEDDLVAILQQAAQEARHFFLGAEPANNMARYRFVDSHGHLLGFNEPSPAKYLYRVLSDREMEQPWPNKKLELLSKEISSRLHSILVECLETIITSDVDYDNDDRDDDNETSRIAMRKSNRETIAKLGRSRNCPLDYFLYHGKQSADSTTTPISRVANCIPHVDRGELIMICLTSVPGLEVMSRSKSVVCPEEVFGKDILAEDEFRLACILTGGKFASILSSLSSSSSIDHEPCVHWVRDDLVAPRLSISYELRCSGN